MKILLHESAPQKRRLLVDSPHTVVTTWFKGWSGLKNGALLSAADEEFDLLITSDQELCYQQNLTARRIAVLVLSTNNWAVIKQGMAVIADAIDAIPAGGFSFVDIGHGRG